MSDDKLGFTALALIIAIVVIIILVTMNVADGHSERTNLLLEEKYKEGYSACGEEITQFVIESLNKDGSFQMTLPVVNGNGTAVQQTLTFGIVQ